MGKQALEGKRLNAFGVDPNDLTIIGLDTKDGVEHPLYDERIRMPVNDGLVKNIRVYGVLEPILVRKIDDRVEVIDGRQRVRAAREANKQLEAEGAEQITVPVMVRRGSDDTLMGIMISTNEQRTADLISTKLKKLERLLAIGRTEEEAAIAFGVELPTIKAWASIMEASGPVRKALEAGKINATIASKLAKLPREEQIVALEEATADGKVVTGKQADILIKKRKAGKEGGEASTNGRKGGVTVMHEPPSKRLLRKLASEESQLTTQTKRTIEWILGMSDGSDIAHLAESLEIIAKKK